MVSVRKSPVNSTLIDDIKKEQSGASLKNMSMQFVRHLNI